MTNNHSLERYFYYVKKFPYLFKNDTSNHTSITIILDKDIITIAQQEFFNKADKEGKLRSYVQLGVVCEDDWYVGFRDLVIFPNGVKAPYVRFINKKGRLQNAYNTVILPYDAEKVFFQKEYKHDIRDWTWITPRGFGERGLSAEENAKKELLEETGFTVQYMTKVSCEDEMDTVLFLAKVDSSIIPKCSDGEEAVSDKKWLTLDQFADWINKGLIVDNYSLRFYVYLSANGFPQHGEKI